MSGVLETLPWDVLACILRCAALRDVAALGRCSRRLHQDTDDLLYKLDAASPDRLALHWACVTGDLAMAKKSIAAGSPVNAPYDSRLGYRWNEKLRHHSLMKRFTSESAVDAALIYKHEQLVLYLAEVGGMLSNVDLLSSVIEDGCEAIFSALSPHILENERYSRTLIRYDLRLAIHHDRETMFDRIWLCVPAGHVDEYVADLFLAAAEVGSLTWTQKLVGIGLPAENIDFEDAEEIWRAAATSNKDESGAVCTYWETLHPRIATDYMAFDRGYHFREVCRTGNVTMARRLLQLGAQPNSSTLIQGPHTPNCPLDFAVQSRNAEMVALLIANGADWTRCQRESEPATLLLFACRFSTVEIVETLLRLGIDQHVELAGANCMHFAITGRNTKVIHYLLSKDFKVPENALTLAWRQRDQDDLEFPSPQFIRLLLEQGADADATDEFGHTPIGLAIRHLREMENSPDSGDQVFQIVKLLLSHGAQVPSPNGSSCSALHGACKGSAQLIDCLLQHNPEAYTLTKQGYTMLHAACLEKNVPVVRLLLERGVDVTGKGVVEHVIDGRRVKATPLEEACVSRYGNGKDRVEVLKLLLERGAAAQNPDLLSLCLQLLCSSRYADTQSFRLLLEHGADPNWRVASGRTVLHDACKNAHTSYVNILLEEGADVHAVYNSRRTPFDEALSDVGFSHKGLNVEIIELLLSYGAGIGKVQITDEVFAAVPGLKKVLRKYIDMDTWETIR